MGGKTGYLWPQMEHALGADGRRGNYPRNSTRAHFAMLDDAVVVSEVAIRLLRSKLLPLFALVEVVGDDALGLSRELRDSRPHSASPSR